MIWGLFQNSEQRTEQAELTGGRGIGVSIPLPLDSLPSERGLNHLLSPNLFAIKNGYEMKRMYQILQERRGSPGRTWPRATPPRPGCPAPRTLGRLPGPRPVERGPCMPAWPLAALPVCSLPTRASGTRERGRGAEHWWRLAAGTAWNRGEEPESPPRLGTGRRPC